MTCFRSDSFQGAVRPKGAPGPRRVLRRLLAAALACALAPGLLQCSSSDDELDPNLATLILLGLAPSLPDYWARLYYIQPAAISDTSNTALIAQVSDTSAARAGSRKIVLITGWDTDDRNTLPFPSNDELKQRALTENWGFFVQTSEYAQLLSDGYEIYTFDYLTSDGIDRNGARLRQKLDAVFGGLTNPEVILYAHSMGGIVARYAVYEGASAPAYLRAVVSNGAPLHGSPWASPQFQQDLGAVYQSLASYLTDTEGGSDLRWDNFDGSLSGASNPKLAALDAKTDRDTLFHAAYGSPVEASTSNFAVGSPTTLSSLLRAACSSLNAYRPHDCLVPLSSSTYQNHSFGSGALDLGDYDHFEINMGVSAVRSALRAKFNSL